MVSLNFPFSFPQPNHRPKSIPNDTKSHPFSGIAAMAGAVASGVAAFAGISPTQNRKGFLHEGLNWVIPGHPPSLPWCSVSLANDSSGSVADPKSGVSFPAVVSESQKLLGIGVRRKNILGLKSIDVYAFGVYADGEEVKRVLGDKYGKLSASELKVNKEFKDDLMGGDVRMTVRLQIIYGRLSIASVRSAFEDSIGSRLQKFGGPGNKDLLQRLPFFLVLNMIGLSHGAVARTLMGKYEYLDAQ
ncbi:hypothetical protein Tsubulata_032245 [Turnera subulata]|uniref:Chalcone isomerase domain-containing protein n=1 Tax=Turnera subulata TaxID=218843 RepID=A0A9Q0GAV1_9ROSI|nr:hypothetical protein Tsubulata_032245 [Turnera subulata]